MSGTINPYCRQDRECGNTYPIVEFRKAIMEISALPKPKKERDLSPRERALLEEVLELTCRSGVPVDGTNFRVAHPSDRNDLRDLEFKTLLASEGHGYYVPILGLSALQTPSSRRILDLGDRLAEALRHRFSDETLRNKEFYVAEIAEHLSITIDECLLVLLHLKEAVENWSGGRSVNWPSKEAWILPSERIFDWPTTAHLIRQLKEWRSPERRQLKHNLLTALNGPTHSLPTALTSPPDWHRDLRPRSLRALFAEIHRARQIDCPALVVLGLRAALDSMCNEMWGDLGTFQDKLHRLNDEGMIGPQQRQLIATAIEIGNATTHRGHIPTRPDAEAVHDIVEGLIKQHYSLGVRASSAARRVPARVKAKKAP